MPQTPQAPTFISAAFFGIFGHGTVRMAGVALPTQGAVEHPGLGSAWAHAIAGFFGVVFAVVVGLGYLVPIAVVLLSGWLVFRRFRRRTPAYVDE